LVLRGCHSEPLPTEAPAYSVKSTLHELAFFLEPQSWEGRSSEVIKYVGEYLGQFRRKKRLNAMTAAQHAGLILSRIEGLERGNPLRRGVKFSDYLVYAAFLGVSLKDLFVEAGQQCTKQGGP
jgi:hypothetical protein